MSSNYSTFICPQCKTNIQASSDMAGTETECPTCGQKFVIPRAEDDNNVIRHELGDDDPDSISAMKSRTIRIELEGI